MKHCDKNVKTCEDYECTIGTDSDLLSFCHLLRFLTLTALQSKLRDD